MKCTIQKLIKVKIKSNQLSYGKEIYMQVIKAAGIITVIYS
jgi:hypothetical protein